MTFIHLGFGEPFPISGSHGLGLGDLLDEVAKNFLKTLKILNMVKK